MNWIKRNIRKVNWFLSARIASWKYPVNKNLIYTAITGTDGKTTTCSFLYEIAKSHGYTPLLITTISVKFKDKEIDPHLKSSTFFAYSIVSGLKRLKTLDISGAVHTFLFLDKEGYERTSEKHRTTPLNSEIRKLIREYEQKGANFFIIETTSHALDQYRVYGLAFDSVAYTNITNEHLDYHGTWKNYAGAKAKLLKQLKTNGHASLNRDDRSYPFLQKKFKKVAKRKGLRLSQYCVPGFENIRLNKFYVSISDKDNVKHYTALSEKTEGSVQTNINILGQFNLFNALAAVSCFLGIKGIEIDEKKAIKAIANLSSINGRMNQIADEPRVIVDFAHTPNGMEQCLKSVKAQFGTRGKLWVIFGCAGLRDHYKRPQMGKLAYDYADNILMTSEDPRTESVYTINNEIVSGFKEEEDQFVIYSYYDGLVYDSDEKFIVRFDEPSVQSRRDAIRFALKNAKKEDTIVVLGKGHETSMCFGETEYGWNDIEEVTRLLPLASKGG